MFTDELLFIDLIKAASVSFVALFPMVNPLGATPVFQALTRHYPRPVQRTLARKVAAYGLLLLLSSFVLGVKVLAFLGISLSVVQVAGGIVIANSGWQLLRRENSDVSLNQEESLQSAMTQAFFPLTMPLTVGPGSISIAITMGAHLQRGDGIETLVAAAIGMLVLCGMVWLLYDQANRLEQALGSVGTEIMIRLSAFALFALGLQVSWNGLAPALRNTLSR